MRRAFYLWNTMCLYEADASSLRITSPFLACALIDLNLTCLFHWNKCTLPKLARVIVCFVRGNKVFYLFYRNPAFVPESVMEGDLEGFKIRLHS